MYFPQKKNFNAEQSFSTTFFHVQNCLKIVLCHDLCTNILWRSFAWWLGVHKWCFSEPKLCANRDVLILGVGYRGSNLGQCFRTCWAPPSLMTLCVLTPFKKKKRKNCEIQGAPAENVKNPRWPPFWHQKCIFRQNSVIFWSFGLILVSNPMFWGSKKHLKLIF